MNLLSIVTVAANGQWEAFYFLDGIEISEREYWIVQFSAMDRIYSDSEGE
jgi:hypothetical protein